MAAHIIRRFWHVSEKQRLVNRIIASSNCWAGINDLRPKYTAISAGDDLKQKETFMKLTIMGKPEEINKLIKLINEGDDETEDFKEIDEIGFWERKSPTAIGL